MTANFLMTVFLCHIRSPKRHEIGIYLLWKSTRKSCMMCRMAPFLMTLNEPSCRNCFRFYYWLEPSCFTKYATDLREIFRFGSFMGMDDCSAVKLGCERSSDVAMATDFRLFNPHFRHSDQCVINFVHSSMTRSTVVSVIHEVDRQRFLLTTPVHRGTDIPPWTFPRDSRATGTTRSASAALNAGIS